MFSHVMIGVSDIERSKQFYDAVFAILLRKLTVKQIQTLLH